MHITDPSRATVIEHTYRQYKNVIWIPSLATWAPRSEQMKWIMQNNLNITKLGIEILSPTSFMLLEAITIDDDEEYLMYQLRWN